MQRFLLVPDRRGLRRQKIDQHRPENRPKLTHIAQMLMLMGRPDPNSSVQREIAPFCRGILGWMDWMDGWIKTKKTSGGN